MIRLTAKTKVCSILGDPVSHSLTPTVHNAAYQAASCDDRYVMTAFCVSAEALAVAMQGIRALGFHGLAITTPLKEAVIDLLDELTPEASAIGAVNSVLNRDGRLIGHNSDWQGVRDALGSDVVNKRVAVLGAGGAAKAAIYGLVRAGALPSVFNRSEARARKLAEKFSIPWHPLTSSASLDGFAAIVNCTTVGMAPHEDKSPLAEDRIPPGATVFDTIYHPRKTRLLSLAEGRGCRTITGLEMFLHQAAAQFEFHTGISAPLEAMRAAAGG